MEVIGCNSITICDGWYQPVHALHGAYIATQWANNPPPNVRLECGCGAKRWQRDKQGSPCAYCGLEPQVAS